MKVSMYKQTKPIKKEYMIRPVVAPETHQVNFKPNTYQIIGEYDYQDDEPEVCNYIGVGPDIE